MLQQFANDIYNSLLLFATLYIVKCHFVSDMKEYMQETAKDVCLRNQ